MYRLANRPTRYDKNVWSYIFMMVKKLKSQMKAHFLVPRNSIFIIEFLTTFKLAFDTINIHVGIGMWVLPFFVRYTLATTLHSRTSASTHMDPAVASVSIAEPLIQKKVLRSYL